MNDNSVELMIGESAEFRALGISETEDVTIIVTKSAGSDGAQVIFIDTQSEPDGSDGSRPLRILLNDTGTVYDCRRNALRRLRRTHDRARVGRAALAARFRVRS